METLSDVGGEEIQVLKKLSLFGIIQVIRVSEVSFKVWIKQWVLAFFKLLSVNSRRKKIKPKIADELCAHRLFLYSECSAYGISEDADMRCGKGEDNKQRGYRVENCDSNVRILTA